MKQPLLLITALLTSWLVTACTTVRYSSADMDLEAQIHREIAVLPAEISYAGPLPKNITPEQIRAMDAGESEMYQQALYEALLRQNGRRVKVKVQPVERTRALLHDQGISLHDSWRMDPVTLAERLGVDAVVRMRVEETRYMSDAAAFGLSVGQALAWRAYRHHPYGAPWPLYGEVRSADMRISCGIFSAQGGDLLWQMSLDRSASWQNPTEEVVWTVSRKIARNFPYR